MSAGWIALHRKIKHHPLWDDAKPFSRLLAWLDLLLQATHKHEGYEAWFQGKLVRTQRGEIVTSLRKLANDWGWSIGKVERFLRSFVESGMIEKRDTAPLRLFVVNYGQYQPKKGATEGRDETPTAHSRDTRETATEQRRDTNNNEKNGENDKKFSVNFSKKEKFTGVQRVINYYIQLFETRYGRKPEIAYGKYGKLLKDKLRRYTADELCELLALYAESDEAEHLGFTLDLFLSAGVFNKLLSRKSTYDKPDIYAHLYQ